MRRVLLAVLVCAVVVGFASPAAADNTLAVSAGCAIQGGFGMGVTHDGTNTQAMVLDNSPVDEDVYRAEFLIRVDSGYSMTTGQNHIIFLGRQLSPNGNPIRVFLKQGVNALKIVGLALDNANGDNKFGSANVALNVPTRITVEWNNSGVVRLYKQGSLRPGSLNGGAFVNSNFDVDQARMGAVGGIDAGTTGLVCYDSFQSFSTF